MSEQERDLLSVADSYESGNDPINYREFAEYFQEDKADGTIIQYLRYLSYIDFNPKADDPEPSKTNIEEFELSDFKHWATLKANKKDCDNDRFRYYTYVALKNYLEAVGEKEKISELPDTRNITKPDSEPPKYKIVEEEIEEMLEESDDDQLRLAIIHMFYAGMRSYEILHITPSWYDFDSVDTIDIEIPAKYAKGKKKSKTPEHCFLPERFEDDIKEYIKEKNDGEDETGESVEVSEAEEEPLFNFVADSDKDFRALARERYQLTRELQDLAIKCGIDPERKTDENVDRITPHRLRKGFVHHLYEGEDGLNLKRTSNLARHDNTDITDTHYLNVGIEQDRQDYRKGMC